MSGLYFHKPLSQEAADKWADDYKKWAAEQPEWIAVEMTAGEILFELCLYDDNKFTCYRIGNLDDIGFDVTKFDKKNYKLVDSHLTDDLKNTIPAKLYKRVKNPKHWLVDVIPW